MATFFGEILQVSSRAVDEDDDDDIDAEEFGPVVMRWEPRVKQQIDQSGKALTCSTLIIAVGSAATGFIESHVITDEYEVVSGLSSGFGETDVKTIGQKSHTDKRCYLYRSNQQLDTFICQCNITVAPEQAFSWTQQLLEHLDLSDTNVAILCSSGTSEYKSDISISDLTTPFVRALKTSVFQTSPFCPYLEQPNVVSGLPAQILTSLHIRNVKAVLYVCYADTIFLDSLTIKTFRPVLKSAPFKDRLKVNPQAEEMLKKMVDLHATHNNLYL